MKPPPRPLSAEDFAAQDASTAPGSYQRAAVVIAHTVAIYFACRRPRFPSRLGSRYIALWRTRAQLPRLDPLSDGP